jgi:ABC-type Fe3+-hydroxamate transport system substrate-binding protein
MANIHTYRLKILIKVFGLYFLSFTLFIAPFLFAQNDTPQRIVSVAPAVSRYLSLLGMEEEVVGVTTYCNVPEFQGKQRIGNIMEVNLEEIIMLKPDLVIATNLTDKKAVQKLRSLNINVEIFDEVKSFDQLCNRFLNLAKVVGKEDIGKEVVLNAKREIADIKEKIKSFSKPKVIVQIGAEPLWVATQNSLISDFVDMAGGVNVGPSAENGLISREYVVKKNPDVIFIIEMGMAAENEKEIWKKFNTINAVGDERMYIIDSYGVCSPTPSSFVETVKEISKLLHPKIK